MLHKLNKKHTLSNDHTVALYNMCNSLLWVIRIVNKFHSCTNSRIHLKDKKGREGNKLMEIFGSKWELQSCNQKQIQKKDFFYPIINLHLLNQMLYLTCTVAFFRLINCGWTEIWHTHFCNSYYLLMAIHGCEYNEWQVHNCSLLPNNLEIGYIGLEKLAHKGLLSVLVVM